MSRKMKYLGIKYEKLPNGVIIIWAKHEALVFFSISGAKRWIKAHKANKAKN